MRSPIPFTDAQLYGMAILYATGTSTAVISESYGISRTSVEDRLHSLGVVLKPRGAPMKMSRQTFRTVKALRERGWSWKMIAKRIDHKGSIKSLMQRYQRIYLLGEQRCFGDEPKWSSYPEIVLRCAKGMHDAGLTWPVIAKAFDASPTALNHAVVRMENESCA